MQKGRVLLSPHCEKLAEYYRPLCLGQWVCILPPVTITYCCCEKKKVTSCCCFFSLFYNCEVVISMSYGPKLILGFPDAGNIRQ